MNDLANKIIEILPPKETVSLKDFWAHRLKIKCDFKEHLIEEIKKEMEKGLMHYTIPSVIILPVVYGEYLKPIDNCTGAEYEKLKKYSFLHPYPYGRHKANSRKGSHVFTDESIQNIIDIINELDLEWRVILDDKKRDAFMYINVYWVHWDDCKYAEDYLKYMMGLQKNVYKVYATADENETDLMIYDYNRRIGIVNLVTENPQEPRYPITHQILTPLARFSEHANKYKFPVTIFK